jgi:hypothetical protein
MPQLRGNEQHIDHINNISTIIHKAAQSNHNT